jgi:hypothetical protein
MDAVICARYSSEREMRPASVGLNPNVAELYRQTLSCLRKELNGAAVRDEAAPILRSLINAVRLIPKDAELEIEVFGNLDAPLAFGSKRPRHEGMTGAKITLVAGEGLEPPTLGL